MKVLTKVMLLSVAMVFMTLSVNAQQWLKDKAEAETDKVATALELSDKEKAKVYDLYLATYKKQKAVNVEYKEKGGDFKAEKKAAMKEVWAEHTVAVKEALGSDLGSKYEAYMKAQKKKGKTAKAKKPVEPKKPKAKSNNKKGNNKVEEKAAKEAAALAEILQWDDAIMEKINAINKTTYLELQVITADVRAKKKEGEEVDMDEVKANKKAIWKKANDEIRALVGKEKYKEYKTARKEVRETLKGK